MAFGFGLMIVDFHIFYWSEEKQGFLNSEFLKRVKEKNSFILTYGLLAVGLIFIHAQCISIFFTGV